MILNFKKLFNFLIILLFFSCSSKQSQINPKNKKINYIPYYLKIYKADSLFLTSNYQESYNLLDSLFKIYEPLNQDIWYEMENYIYSAYKIGKIKKIKPILTNLISKWGYNYENQLNNDIKALEILNNSEVDSLEKIYNNSINWDYRDSIINFNKIDQFYRLKGYKQYAKQIDSIEHILYDRISNYYQNNIPLGKIHIGNRTRKENSSIGTILIHIRSLDSTDYVANKVLNDVKKGFLPPINYATMIDRNLQLNNKKQNYYTWDEELVLKTSDSILIKQINLKRKSIGLYPIEYMQWRNSNLGL